MRQLTSRLVILLVMAISTKTLAQEAVLTLTASGMIIKPPHWEDSGNNTITTLNFDFSGAADPARHHQDVDSQTVLAKLVDAIQPQIMIDLIRPKKCKIGVNNVQDEHVHFVHASHSHENDGKKIQIQSGVLQKFALRFSKAGHYRDKFGVVSCEIPGSLTYEY